MNNQIGKSSRRPDWRYENETTIPAAIEPTIAARVTAFGVTPIDARAFIAGLSNP
jgi:hypothetical protein